MSASQESDQPEKSGASGSLQAFLSERESLTDDTARKGFARRMLDLGQKSLALEMCQEILSRCPNDFDVQSMHVEARLRPGLIELDIEFFAAEIGKLVAGKNLQPEALLRVAKLYQTIGCLKPALQIIKHVEATGDTSVQTARQIIYLMVFKGDHRGACTRLRRFLRRSDVVSASMREFSELALKCGRPRLAIALASKRLRDHPDDIDAIVGLSLFLARAKKLRKARGVIEPVIDDILQSGRPFVIIDASEALGRVGLFDARHRLLSKAVGVLPNNSEIVEALRSARYTAGSSLLGVS